jgi:exodeoxyribonuclease VII small subunit
MSKHTDTSPSFAEGLDRLEQIVTDLEQGELEREKSLELFEQGVA